MTYDADPIRWTESIAEAPDALRAPFASARNEAPSDLQMRALALKLAALSAGTAAAASAATAKAASGTAGGTAATSAGTFSVAKVAVSVALLGATVTGAVVWQSKVQRAPTQKAPAAQVAAPSAVDALAPSVTAAPTADRGRQLAPAPQAVAPVTEQLREIAEATRPEPAAAPAAREQAEPVAARTAHGPRALARRASSAQAPSVAPSMAAAPEQAAEAAGEQQLHGTTQAGSVSEVELLRRARVALATRPREAFGITQEHRALYPHGMFAQERDALAIEALMRAGDGAAARKLAEQFVREHPDSPHAHRFRETMGLP
jgi:hypothetical protein